MKSTLNHLIQKLIRNTATRQELDELRNLLNEEENLREANDIFGGLFDLPRSQAEGLTRLECLYMLEYMNSLRPSDRKRKFPLSD